MRLVGIAVGPYWFLALAVMGVGLGTTWLGYRPNHRAWVHRLGWALLVGGGFILSLSTYVWLTSPTP